MLAQPTPFPQVGSYGLHRVQGGTRLARIQQRDCVGGEDYALISYPSRTGASGNLTVPLADLIDATPLTDDENRELRALSGELPSRRAARNAAKLRLEQLANRRIFARVLQEEMIRLGLATRPLDASDASESAAA